MIVPVGERYQQTLYLFEKKDGELEKVALLPTLFVPMTGKAEEGRVTQPDPLHPTIHNGGFEELTENEPAPDDPSAESHTKPAGWHYQRQLDVAEEGEAPEGSHFVTFTNNEPGRGAQALQGMPVDGRKVRMLDVSLWVKGTNLQRGPSPYHQPTLGISFYDANRAEAGYRFLGPWRGSFDWQLVRQRIPVPTQAREAVVRIGLCGATGELSVDAIRIGAAD